MRDLIIRNLEGRKVLVLFLLTSLIYALMLTVTIPEVMRFSKGMQLLDMIPTGYDAAYVAALLDILGEQGRHAYLFRQIPMDMIYPLLFGVTYSLVFGYFLKKLGKVDGSFFFICFLPLLAALFDYAENFGIITLLNSYPDQSVSLSRITNVFSVLKSLLTTIYFILLIIVVLVYALKKLFQRNKLPG
jgi:hypothetical protein